MTLAGLLADLGFAEAPSTDLAYLLSGVLDCPVTQLPLLRAKELEPELATRIVDHLTMFRSGEPPQYTLGKAWFWGLELRVDPRVLIPRPETEGLAEIALSLLPKDALVLEIGTGSGALALTLKKQRPDLCVTATDISSAALTLARENAARHACSITFVETDLFPPGDGRFDLIISNPPYVSDTEYQELEPSVRDFEPRLALLAGLEGLDIYRCVFARLKDHLTATGIALFEHGATQREQIIALGATAGLQCFLARDDLAGRNRYLGFSPSVLNKP